MRYNTSEFGNFSSALFLMFEISFSAGIQLQIKANWTAGFLTIFVSNFKFETLTLLAL
jgi:hypothetical protein